ncbi:MAG: ATP synthase F1 subunit epsilon [Opitutae bacterium]|nr:ATP synthase F1 subunit epsilon [Opitutae bacterium]MBT4667185.1 ATP synthase F1 subunit epsilon [Opitutae bacterium]MBT6850297.1 ATP synthase F1 subunit epsilon [Opitutae bacterium]MBT7741596.1 ATP synthase F1 subunit epsilon [Opitutae bacterium]
MPLLLEIVTPDAKVFSETVDEVGLPTSEGRMHILPHHVPVIAKLKAGEIKVHRGNVIEMLAVGSGFIEVYGDKVSILTDQAINVEEIDDTEIEEAVKRAKEALEEGKKSNIDAAEIDRLEAEARFAFAKQIARAKRR